MLIDTSAYIGPWPFAHLPARSATELQDHLRAHGITQALVSHLGAVFASDPMPANRSLFADTRRHRSLVPVPILNPMLAVAGEHLEECCRLVPQMRAVRIVPSYHEVDLRSPRMARFISDILGRGLRLIVTVRLVDARLDYPGLRIKPVTTAAVTSLLRSHPRLHPLLCGLTLTELQTLVRASPQFEADIPFVEWLYALETLLSNGARNRYMFGSHTPFFVAQAIIGKLSDAAITSRRREAIAWKNAAHFFALSGPNTAKKGHRVSRVARNRVPPTPRPRPT